jgi:hypothetical protein
MNGKLHRMVDGRFIDIEKVGLPINGINAIFVDHVGAVWITSSALVMRWMNGIATAFTDKDGMPAEPIYSITEDNEHTLWMGSNGGGLVRMKDGKITRYIHKQGLYDNVVYVILEDDENNLWMSSNRGVFCVSKSQLNDFADGKIDRIQCKSFTASEGMITSECSGNSQPAGCKTADGRLWFPTIIGLVVVDPQNLNKNRFPPQVTIERAVLNTISRNMPKQFMQIPPGAGSAEFHFAALTYITPEQTQFRYRLEGFDTDWTSVGNRHEANYTNLRPGKYTFRVTASNNDGVWNETGASFAFELMPYFYQTYWFYGLMLAVVIGSGFGAYRMRVWQLLKSEEELQQRVDESLARIKVLGGLIPICSNCKKIRDDKGYWNLLEQYIYEHSEATFSHGVCPECAEKLYGKYYTQTKKPNDFDSPSSPPTDSAKE